MKNKTAIKMLFYFGGLIIMSFGVSLSVRSDLGVSPISSIPYTITVVTGIDLGLTTMMFSTAAVLFQILLLRKMYKPINLLQLPIGIVFGLFLTAFVRSADLLPAPETFEVKIIFMLVSTVFIALGVFLYVSAGFLPLPPEGFLLAVTQITHIPFPTVKTVGDVTMVMISLVTCLITVHEFGSIGIGTIAAALLVGTEVRWMTMLWGEKRDRLLGKSE